MHITLNGIDKIAYQFLDNQVKIMKDYDDKNDYLLGKGSNIISLNVPKGYFCIIPNHFGHVALYDIDEGVEKIVLKMPTI